MKIHASASVTMPTPPVAKSARQSTWNSTGSSNWFIRLLETVMLDSGSAPRSLNWAARASPVRTEARRRTPSTR